MTKFRIRRATAGDREGVEELLLATFSTSSRPRLVRQLREGGDVVLSLVAMEEAALVGQALSSRLRKPAAALALAPVSDSADRVSDIHPPSRSRSFGYQSAIS